MLPTKFLQDVDLLFSNAFNSDKYTFISTNDCDVRYPVFDQRYNDEVQQIIISVPGATKKDLSVDLKGNILSISRHNEIYDKNVEEENETFHYNNRRISKKKFDIAFKIPNKWNAEKMDVELENGELIITIPIKEEEKEIVKTFQIK